MPSRPWMPLYVADYLADTTHLDAAESGAYLHLIMHYWLNDGLPDSDRQLARIARMSDRQWAAARATLADFFHDGWRHKRIDAELAKASDVSSKRRAAAEQRHSKPDAIAEQLDTHARASSLSQSQKKDAANAAPPAAANGLFAEPDPDAELFRRGRELFGKESGGLMVKLKKAKHGSISEARKALEAAARKDQPREFIGRVIAGRETDEDWPSGIPGVT